MDSNRKFPLILSSFWLKVIALLTMTIDHLGFLLFNYNYELSNVFRHIGRLALPLFCFMIVEGAIHTKNFKKYALRLGVMASLISLAIIISDEVPFFRDNGFSMRDQGVIFLDLLLGATAVFCLRQKKWYFKVLAILPLAYGIASFIATSYECPECGIYVLWFPYFMRTQYGWYAILMCILFYFAVLLANVFISYLSGLTGINKENYRGSNIERHVINIFSVIMLALATVALYICGRLMPPRYVFWVQDIQLFAIVSGAFILLYNGNRGYNKKWFQYGSYLYYPLHMAILYLIFSLL
ncbi:MAG: hypothetical protein IJR08_00830 [Bacilli bacterium]|nr:hypothetical protein [Bacilli bacterium]